MLEIGDTVLIVRHAESASNAGLVTDDPTEIPLTDEGRAQAQRFAALVHQAPRRVISSTYTRALDTARPLLTRHGIDPEFSDIHEFTYLAPARCRGTNRRDRRPWVQDYWTRCDPDYRDGDGAETFGEFTRRVLALRRRLGAGQHRGDVLFSHGLFMKALMWVCEFDPAPDDPGSMTAFMEFSARHWVPNVGVLRVTVGSPRPRASLETRWLDQLHG